MGSKLSICADNDSEITGQKTVKFTRSTKLVIASPAELDDAHKEKAAADLHGKHSKTKIEFHVPESPAQVESPVGKDLMISYSHEDKEFMMKLKENLEKNGFSVWVDVSSLAAGVDFLQKIGQAIIESQLFILLVTKMSLKSKYCQDELALAYISDKSIFPVSLSSRDKLIPFMATGTRLSLARFQWIYFLDPNNFDKDFLNLLNELKAEMGQLRKEKEEEVPKHREGSRKHDINRGRRSTVRMEKVIHENCLEYWDRHYKEDRVKWSRFLEDLCQEYKTWLNKNYATEDQEWLMEILHHEMNIGQEEMLEKENYLDFCMRDGVLCPLWQCVEDQARESYAMREVFKMDSSVRVEAIENLGKFKSIAVVDALQNLLADKEPNVKTVAAITLARTGTTDMVIIKQLMKSLNDKDRLVREAGCLALGRLHAQAAIPKLIQIWRNDVIADVRSAASLALKQIGGEEFEQAVHITDVLANEIRMLTEC